MKKTIKTISICLLQKVFTGIIHYATMFGTFWKKAIWKKYKPVFDYCYLKYFGVETELGHATLFGLPIIKKHQNSRIVLGQGVVLTSSSMVNPAGINHPVILATLGEGAVIELKERSAFSGVAICSVKKVVVGEHSQIGANTGIYDTDFHKIDPAERRAQQNISDANAAPVFIGNNVWVGANALILKGVSIGDEAVVGTGAVVVAPVPAKTIFAGNPARYVRRVDKEAV